MNCVLLVHIFFQQFKHSYPQICILIGQFKFKKEDAFTPSLI